MTPVYLHFMLYCFQRWKSRGRVECFGWCSPPDHLTPVPSPAAVRGPAWAQSWWHWGWHPSKSAARAGKWKWKQKLPWLHTRAGDSHWSLRLCKRMGRTAILRTGDPLKISPSPLGWGVLLSYHAQISTVPPPTLGSSCCPAQFLRLRPVFRFRP